MRRKLSHIFLAIALVAMFLHKHSGAAQSPTPIPPQSFGQGRSGTDPWRVIIYDASGRAVGSIQFPAYVAFAPQLPADPKRGALPSPAATVKGAAQSPGAADLAGVVNLSPNPSLQCPYTVEINQTSSSVVVPGVAGKLTHFCTFAAVTATGQSVSLVQGTGSTCGTGTKGLYGGTTASAVWADKGGVHGISDRITIPGRVVGGDTCMLQSAAANISGTLTYGFYN